MMKPEIPEKVPTEEQVPAEELAALEDVDQDVALPSPYELVDQFNGVQDDGEDAPKEEQ